MNYSRLPRLVFTINYLNSTYKYNHTVKRFYLITLQKKLGRNDPVRKGRAETMEPETIRSVTYLSAFVFSYTVVQAPELSDRRRAIYFGTF